MLHFTSYWSHVGTGNNCLSVRIAYGHQTVHINFFPPALDVRRSIVRKYGIEFLLHPITTHISLL